MSRATRARNDDWISSTSSLGGVRDKHRGISFGLRDELTRPVLDALYKQNPLCARIVDRLVEDAFREGWDLTNVETRSGQRVDVKKIRSELDDLGVDQAFQQAATWSRLHGAALNVIPVLFSGKPSKPLVVNRKSPLLRLATVPAERALPLRQDVGLFSPTYGRVLEYQITGLASTPVDVHHSRVISWEPIQLPLETLLYSGNGRGWGPSVLERVWDDIARDGAAASHAVSILYIASIFYVKMQDYKKEHSTKAGAERIRRMLADIRANLDSLGVMGLDKMDDLGAVQLAITGAHETLDRMRDRVAASANYPREILYNESPTGLRGGELTGAQELYYASVANWQKKELAPRYDRVLELYFAWKGIDAIGWEIEFKPLFTKSDAQSADTHSKNAAADAIYLEHSVVTPAEIREHRIVQGNAGPLAVVAETEGAEPLDLTDPTETEVASQVAANTPAAAESTPADEALTGVQITSAMEIQERMNLGRISYAQARGAVALSFPKLRGREHELLGPAPADENAKAGAPVGPGAPAPSQDELPGDRVTVQAAAQRFGIKTRSITRMIEKGLVPFWGFGAHRVVSLAAVEAAAKAHETEVEAEDPNDPHDQDPPPDENPPA